MKACQDTKLLLALRPADRTAEEAAQLAAHLATCPACAALSQAYAEQDDLLCHAPSARLTRAQRENVIVRVEQEKRRYLRGSRWSKAWQAAALTPVLVGLVLGLGLMLGARFLLQHDSTLPATEAPTAEVGIGTAAEPENVLTAPVVPEEIGTDKVTPTPTQPPPTPFTGVDGVLDCAAVYPGAPGCLQDEPLVTGELAFVDERAPFDNRPTLVGLGSRRVATLGDAPDGLRGWSPSGAYLLTTRSLYRANGEPIRALDACIQPFWAPSAADAVDRLICRTREGGLEVIDTFDGTARQVLPPDSLPSSEGDTVVVSAQGEVAWTPGVDALVEAGSEAQVVYVGRLDAGADATKLHLSDDIRETYYQLLDWVPGTRLILAGRGMLSASIWTDGVPLVTINADTGEVTALDVVMLLTPEAYDWHPSRPGMLALVIGAGRFITENKRLALLDVSHSEVTYLTDETQAAFAPAWSPDGALLAYATAPASPAAEGDGEALEQRLEGRAIHVVNPTTLELHVVTLPGTAIDGWPTWSVDGQQLLYTRQHDGQTDVRVTTLDGSRDALLLTGLPDKACFYGGCGWDAVLAYAPVPALPTPLPREQVTLNRLIHGTIVEIQDDALILESPERGRITVYLLPETRIWKGGWDTDRPLEIGDEVGGLGEPNAELTAWEAESLEVNVVYLRGKILRVAETAEGAEIDLRDARYEQVYTVQIPAALLAESSLELSVGGGLNVVGLRLKDGTVLAVTLG